MALPKFMTDLQAQVASMQAKAEAKKAEATTSETKVIATAPVGVMGAYTGALQPVETLKGGVVATPIPAINKQIIEEAGASYDEQVAKLPPDTTPTETKPVFINRAIQEAVVTITTTTSKPEITNRSEVEAELLSKGEASIGWNNTAQAIKAAGLKLPQGQKGILGEKALTKDGMKVWYNKLPESNKVKVLSSFVPYSVVANLKQVGTQLVGMIPIVGTAVMWNRMSPNWQKASIAIDVATLGLWGMGAMGAKGIALAKIYNPKSEFGIVMNLAKKTGTARNELKNTLSAVRNLEKVGAIDTKAALATGRAQTALLTKLETVANNSERLDRIFAEKFQAIKTLSQSDMKWLEKKSGFIGLQSNMSQLNKAQKNLTKGWKGLDEVLPKKLGGQRVYEIGSADYTAKLTEIQKLQDALERAYENLGKTLYVQGRKIPKVEFLGHQTEFGESWRFDPADIATEKVGGKGSTGWWGAKEDLDKIVGKTASKTEYRYGEPKPQAEASTIRKRKALVETVEKPTEKPKIAVRKVTTMKTTEVYGEKEVPKIKPRAPKIIPEVGAGASTGLAWAVSTLTISTVRGKTATYAPSKIQEDTDIGTKIATQITPDIQTLIDKATKGGTVADSITQTAIEQALKSIAEMNTAGMTKTQINNAIKQQVHNSIKNQISQQTEASTRTELATKTATMTQTATRTTTRIATLIRDRVKQSKIRGKIRLPVILSDDGKPLTEKQVKGAIGWKQGWIYKVIYPPYKQKNVINSKTPIEGIRMTEGARSAYNTLVVIGGKLPHTIKRDMGIMDITITTLRGDARPTMRVVRDRRLLKRRKHHSSQSMVSVVR